MLNARYALNAANARWGSLYDALYGTDVIPETDGAEKGKGYNPVRGAKVIAFARDLLDRAAPLAQRLAQGRHRLPRRRRQAGRHAADGGTHRPGRPGAVRRLPGRRRSAHRRCCCEHNGLHIDIQHRPQPPHRQDRRRRRQRPGAGSALSTILDLEDSVAAVDADDKVLAYRNWLGILQGTLTEEVSKGGKTFTRGLNPDRVYTGADGKATSRCTAAR